MSDKYVNVELFALTYGSLVRSIAKETNNIEDANAKLFKIGTSIGNRITDDLVVHQDSYNIKTFRQACDLIAGSFKTYLGVTCHQIDQSENSVTFRITENPITRYVTIPLEYDGLVYLTPLLGALKTIFEMLHFSTEVKLVVDSLRSNANSNDIEVKLIEVLTDTLPLGEYLN
ncbi:Trafficking protein particle complex subunit 3 [Histomonas meleagridis]|uniref:Trafficking protein particle complex subunit 3 n=1 Tax=Histomonas meleagridis TaxID=135588 RepID=UPI00355A1967|nr:Trafficking protein particle complex subunit 3 [Histomonas meleagridis]KAH0802968.1 Trafficking protein particle complex subunit 3 [Histomonas meleagridis]